jgi:hypothetical protein
MLRPSSRLPRCICLYHFSRKPNCPAERLDHLIAHYIVVAEHSCKDCPIINWKEDISELTSQLFQALELWRKLRNGVLKSVFVYVAKFRVGYLPIVSSMSVSRVDAQ